MKQKLFTLLALMLCLCSGAWAYDALPFKKITETTLIYTSPTNLTATGYAQDGKGTQTYSAVSSRGKAMDPTKESDGNYDIGANGTMLKSANSNKEVMLYVSNVTNIEVYCKNNSKDDRYPIITATPSDGTTAATVNGSALNSSATASGKTSLALDGSKNYTISIHSNDADITFYALRLTAQAKTVSSTTLTGIKINGTAWDISALTDNAATITDECAGPPTVQFVYTANYDDGTSKTGLTEDAVAVSDGASYVATSTELTTKVTLTFTNVSNTLFSMTDPTGPTESIAAKGSPVAVTATFAPGCSAMVFNGHGSNAAQLVYNGEINLNGSGGSYFQANFTSALAEGDIITCSNTDADKLKLGAATSSAIVVTFPYTIPAGSNLIGKKTVYVLKNASPATFKELAITRPKVISSQTLGGVKKGETTLVENTDYTVSGTTITLADAYKAVIAPTDISIVNHITYSDASTTDEDVAVELAKSGDNFEGTATIGTTTYTVVVPVDASTPTLALSAASGTISLNSYTPTGSAKVTLTGANLTAGTYNAPTAEGVTIAPETYTVGEDGTVNQEFTITSTATTAASTAIEFAYTGAETQTYTLSYEKAAQNSLTQTTISEATTWDWAKAGTNTIELNASTSPTNAEEFLMANLPEVNNNTDFNSQALMVTCQFPTRGNNKYFQGYSIKFNTSVPGTIDVTFSNTGSKRPYRYLRVNGNMTSYKDGDGKMVEATGLAVPAGEVVIDFYIPNASDPQERSGDVIGTTMCRVSKIVFTPATATTIALNASGYATYSNYYPVEVSGAKAYTATLDFDNATITCTEITSAKVPAGEGVLLFGEAGAGVTLTPTTEAAALTGNDLKGTTLASGLTATKGTNTYYVLSGDTFKKFTGSKFAANKAYFETAEEARTLRIVFNGGTTGITSATQQQASQQVYNLSGQRVAQPVRGLYIVGGKKVVMK